MADWVRSNFPLPHVTPEESGSVSEPQFLSSEMGRAVLPLYRLVKRTHEISGMGPVLFPSLSAARGDESKQIRSFMDHKGLWYYLVLDPFSTL